MATTLTRPTVTAAPHLLGTVDPSPAGPTGGDDTGLREAPAMDGPAGLHALRFSRRPMPFLFGGRRTLGPTFSFSIPGRARPFTVVTHPDHAKALFTAPPESVPSITADSPLRPICGESVLTANGKRHMRQRRLLLPPFHGEAIAKYAAGIEEMIHRELDTWTVGSSFPLAARMQAVTLDVIMAGIFGVEGEPAEGTTERKLRDATRRVLAFSETPAFALLEIRNVGLLEPRGIMKRILDAVDVHYFGIIRERRALPESARGTDVLSLLLSATDEDGQTLTDQEIRDELITLVLAGHETTANQLAWTFERLTRTPDVHATLKDLVRSDDPMAAAYVDATVSESMRVRPVISMVGRIVQEDWRFGDHVVRAGGPVAVGSVLIHHREDLYPQPFRFAPERFLKEDGTAVKPGTYTWLPFGGGTRRCLGAALALAEQRIVIKAIAERVDLEAPDLEPEREYHRNVTTIPRGGGRVVVTALR
ncbi:cytochrome P450 [Conexibacter sp. W3-3-2]|uniref:cytochrome P450 n=1 Tax=Conexibacter sp. W3-3-2 TaxID=2675227 RepID=UPI0012B9D201|nr:cytochrome P450 [Conexibacter sp. W3-3-2]MTD45915.1 cytochrome P450 [Conexibacter sp. W3-3-2]